MKGIRFYLEYDSPRAKRENRNNGNVIAVITNGCKMEWSMPAIAKNLAGDICNVTVHKDLLKKYTVCISEPIARIHNPKLFEVLDNLNAKKI